MDIQQLLQSLAERLSSSASVKNVYGDPVMHADRTVIPMARVRYGFGAGGGSGQRPDAAESRGGGGGGGRVSAQPCGAIEITPLGTRFIDFEDKRKIAVALALGFALGAAVVALTGERLRFLLREHAVLHQVVQRFGAILALQRLRQGRVLAGVLQARAQCGHSRGSHAPAVAHRLFRRLHIGGLAHRVPHRVLSRFARNGHAHMTPVGRLDRRLAWRDTGTGAGRWGSRSSAPRGFRNADTGPGSRPCSFVPGQQPLRVRRSLPIERYDRPVSLAIAQHPAVDLALCVASLIDNGISRP